MIQVWDTGIGIEPRYGEQIFEECFQVGNPVRDRTKGLGLGLSIARRMARLLGGEVSYRSRFGARDGVRSDFAADRTIGAWARWVRAVRRKRRPAGVEEVLRERIRGRRIVVVEDDPMVSKSIELSLATLGARVEVFGNAENALLSPDIVGADFYISDFSLPGLNGLQIARPDSATFGNADRCRAGDRRNRAGPHRTDFRFALAGPVQAGRTVATGGCDDAQRGPTNAARAGAVGRCSVRGRALPPAGSAATSVR